MSNHYISVKISGTPLAKSGFIPIVNVNDASFDIDDAYPSSDASQPCYYAFTVQPDFTIYKLVFNNMRTVRGVADAKLVVAMSIPAGLRLPDGVSPLTVLHQLLDAFLQGFAKPDERYQGKYDYDINGIDTSLLESICMQYPLQPDDNYRCAMQGADRRAVLTGDDQLIETVLNDVNNSAYTPYSEVVIGNRVNSTLIGEPINNVALIYQDEANEVADEVTAADAVQFVDATAEETLSPTDDYVMPGPPPQAFAAEDNSQGYKAEPVYDYQEPQPTTEKKRRGKGWMLILALLIGLAVGCFCTMKYIKTEPTVVTTTVTDTVRIEAAPQAPDTVYVDKPVEVPVKTVSNQAPTAQTVVESVEETITEAETEDTKPVMIYDPETERQLKR